MSGSESGLQVGPVPPQDRDQALDLAFSYLEPAERRRQVDESFAVQRGDRAAVDGLIGAWRAGRLVGAMFSQVQPGRIASVCLPRLVAGEPESTAIALLAVNEDLLCRQQVGLAHVLLREVGVADEALLQLGGFVHLADLLYLVSPKSRFPATPPASQLDFEPYQETEHQRLARIIEATYEATLDCPQLEGMRSTEDVLASYRGNGVFDPNRWLIVRHGQDDVGCLLLADQPRQDSMELLYMGVIRAARGHGWGRQFASRAQWLARLAGRKQLVLAVDSLNTPAIRSYLAVGFQAWQERRLYVRQSSGR
jgi:GNAT superfamily N-acetyltransferase